MNIIHQLLYKFYEEEYTKTIVLIFICILTNIIQTNGISSINAKIINSIKQSGDTKNIQSLVILFIVLSITYLILYYLFKVFQNQLLTKLRQWIKNQLVRVLLKSNNENFSEQNFIKLNSPINRMSSICFMISSDILTFILPTLIFLLVISVYFLYNNLVLGTTFIATNILIIIYLRYIWESTMEKNTEYEENATHNEFYLLEILNNIDKIVYRGQVNDEIKKYDSMINKTIQKAYEFYAYTNLNGIIMNAIVYCAMFFFIIYCIYLFKIGKMSLELFITLFSIIILYRERMAIFIQQVPDFVEFIGRTNSILKYFENVDINKHYGESSKDGQKEIPFETIEFRDVSFKYKSRDSNIFENLNLKLNTTNNKIIGMVGLSGRGKSSLSKLLLKMYEYEGDIFIDGINIRELDTDYIRKNITYVNQNSKLFDRLIIDNMLYGCSHEETCYAKIDEIIKNYPKIAELFNNIDIYKKKTGPLGEHLSGGQRQIVNIVGGLANPSKILILDEPTNALDSGLKSELLRLIYENRTSKQCIIIITHDKDVHGILNEKIAL